MTKLRLDKECIYKYVIALLFPALLCIAYLAVRGIRIDEVFLPASINNDCSFYYKMIEGIVERGMPDGYFGFNESHALKGGLAAWNPAIYLPWTIWGKLFGWNYFAPVLCNILLFSISLCLFTALTRPGNFGFFSGLLALALFPSLPIHLMNCLPEAVLAAHFILFLGLAARTCELVKSLKTVKDDRACRIQLIICIALSMLIIMFLSLIRPFLITFMAVPVIAMVRAFGKKTLFIPVIALAITLAIYYYLTRFYTADYFRPLFDTSFIKQLVTGNFHDAAHTFLDAAYSTWSGVKDFLADAFSYGNTAGTQYFMTFMGLVGSVVLTFSAGQKTRRLYYAVYSIALTMTIGAIFILLHLPNEGARHLWMFAVAGCLIMPEALTSHEGRTRSAGEVLYAAVRVVTIAFLVFFMVKGSLVPTDYDVPVGNADLKRHFAECKEAFKDIVINPEAENRYENTVDWVIRDEGADGMIVTEYAPLYALPSGVGISCCEDSYILENIDSLNGRYIYTDVRGQISDLCIQKGMHVVASVGNIVVYENI